MASRRKKAPSSSRRANLESLESRLFFAVQVAENLLVSIDATNLPAGDANDVPNTGTLGGVFEATGGDPTTMPVIGRPAATATSGTQGIRFDGTDFLQLVDAPGGSLITAPAGITGADPTVSIETWVWNPAIPGEETMVSFGHRGGPDGTNMSFNYGNDNRWGAVGHWGSSDAGWGPEAGPQAVPAAKHWHHLVYTYDGTATRLYVDGSLLYTETLGPGVISTHPDTAINLATQLEADGVTPTGALRGNLTLGRVRIHDGVLTDAQVAENYNTEKGDFVEPVIPVEPPPPATLLVSVDATKLPEGTGDDVADTGPLGGVFRATGGGEMVPVIGAPLPTATGGTRGIRLDGDDYLQLVDPATGDLITAPSSITGLDPKQSIEVWVWNPGIPTEETMVAWGKRGGPDGTNMSFNYGSSPDFGAVGHWGSPDIGWGPNGPPAARQWHLLSYTYDGNTTRVYADGQLVNSEELGPGVINTAPDTAINLGTQLEGDGVTPTGGLRGSLTLGKVRIYTGVLTDAQIAANYNTEKTEFVEPQLPPPPPAEILVNIDATKLPAGPANDIPNTGPLGGVFEATGGDPTTVPVIDTPLPGASSGTKGIRLDGTDFLQLLTAPAGDYITAPADITGLDPKHTIETWVWNPNIADEETMVSFGKRGGPDGSNVSFNYGRNPDYGAVGHWGAQDIGYGANGAPVAQQWHHIVYSYDGSTSRIYVDGQLVNSEALGEGALNVHPDTPINLGTQLEADGITPTGGLRGSLTLGKVRIYKGVLSDAQIAANFNTEKTEFVNPTITATPLTAAPVHRYSFTNAAGDATGATVVDSIGGSNGIVQGAGATWNGTQLALPGGPSSTAAYIDLPNGILSSLGAANGGSGQVTFEGWVHHSGNQAWSRFYDFGSTTEGEQPGPGGGGTGSDYWMLTAQNGADTTTHRYEIANFDDGQGNNFNDVTGDSLNTTVHYAATWDETTGELKLFVNGVQITAYNSPILISAINDVNNWLGRSNYTADANLQGEYDEFRIYNRVLTPGEIVGDFQAGPDVLTNEGGARVTDVYVRGTNWSNTFRNFVATQAGQNSNAGVRVTDFGVDSPVLSFSNLDTIAVKFTGAVPPSLAAGSVTISSVAGRTYTVQSVTVDPTDSTLALIKLDSSIANDRVVVRVTGVTTATGGAVVTRLNVLPGDVNQSAGAVNAADLVLTRNRVGRTTANPGTGPTAYSIFNDLNGDGLINASDLVLVRNNVGKSLPAPPPAVFSSARVAPARSSLVARSSGSILASIGLDDADDQG